MKATLLLLLSLGVCRAAVQTRALISSGRTQYFEYDHVSLTCGRTGDGDWTVWRYTSEHLKMSQCGSGWGVQTSSSCFMKTVKMADSGVYWCESDHRQSSNAVNITVTGGPVILQSPVLPVTEGGDVTLSCSSNKSSDFPAAFYKGSALIGRGPHVTVRNFSKSDEGPYHCTAGGKDSPPSWLLMNGDAEPVSLTVSPDSSQLFEYETLSLSCGANSSFGGWKVVRSPTVSGAVATSDGRVAPCGDAWGSPTPVGCDLFTAKRADSATYWCESPARQRSDSVGITVYDTPVILQSPVHPVVEGAEVTLTCRTRTTSDLSAHFYKDGAFVRTEPAGHMTVHNVSKRDEGLYVCVVDGDKSPPSWLLVTEVGGASSSAGVTLRVILHLVVFCPYCIATGLMVSAFRQQQAAGRKQPVSMTTFPASEDDEGSARPRDDAAAANVLTERHVTTAANVTTERHVTTEHHF